MSERLNELQRQRALLQEHLAWLEREISTEMTGTGAAAAPGQPAQAPAWPAPQRAPAPVSSAAAEQQAEGILERYREEANNSPQDVRRGCFLYFALAFVMLGAVLVIWYFLKFKRH